MIRYTLPEDLQQICMIEKETFSEPWSENSFRSSLDHPDYVYMTALTEDGKTVTGYCGYVRSFETANITNMAVRKEFRGRGIGKQLLSKIMEAGYRQGVEQFTLEVRVSNSTAVGLYESLGYHTEGIRKNFYSHPVEDALIMWTDNFGRENKAAEE